MRPKTRHPSAQALIGVLALAVAVVSLSLSCVVNPATGKRQLALVSEAQEIQLGRETDEQIVAMFGIYEHPGLESLVRGVGQRLAEISERPELPWTFRVVDDPSVNAFAVPGGFIYMTRGILAHFNSEAELAAVVGHEIGHVTARHSVTRMSRAQVAGIGLGVGMILAPELQEYGQLAEIGLGLVFLRFSRDDERQADDLGLRYVVRGGYDPRPMMEVFELLGRVSQLEGGGRLPGWLATHPHPEDRHSRIEAQILALDEDFRAARVETASYLDALDGIVFGRNPRQGFFQGTVYLHPDHRYRFGFPEGWSTQAQRQAAAAQSPERDAVIEVSLASQATPSEAAQAFFGIEGVQPGQRWPVRISGLDTEAGSFRARTGQGVDLEGLAAFVAHEGRVLRLLGVATRQSWSARQETIRRSLTGFGQLTDPAILAIQPWHVDIVRLPQAMTIEEFQRRYPSPLELDRLAVLNHVQAGEVLPAGQRIKRVVGKPLPE